MNTLSTMTLSQRVVNTIAFAQAASTMFAMAQMLGRRKGQLKMPRLDAYAVTPSVPKDGQTIEVWGVVVAAIKLRVGLVHAAKVVNASGAKVE